MKRRNFLSLSAAGIGLAGMGPAGAAADGRLFGAPQYARGAGQALGENRMRLALSRMEMPVEAWEPLLGMSRVWNTVLQDDATRHAFLAAPRRFLARRGIPPSVIDRSPQEFRLLRLVCDPYVRHVAAAGNYGAFISRLKESNLLHDDAENSLRRRVRRLLAADIEQLRRRMPDTGTGVTTLSDLTESADLYAVTRELAAANGETQAVAAAMVVVVVAALAATYVSVGVNVTVVLNLGFSISVAVSVSIGVGGAGGGGDSCADCHSYIGAVAGLEPKMHDNLDQTIRAARLTGQPTFETEALKDYICTETRACLEAAESLAALNLPSDPHARGVVINGVARLTCRAAGLV